MSLQNNNIVDSFKGLSREIWWLAIMTFINRAGTMVIPFLSLYLRESQGLTHSQVGWIWTGFGVGSVMGSWLGGKLADKIGFYRTMWGSLLLTGFAFIALQFVEGFWPFVVGIMVVMTIADAFRPASFVAVRTYSRPENKTRSITLIRLAINLGFGFGPAVGGLIITYLSYSGLFWVDGVTCFCAAFLLINVLNPKKSEVIEEVKVKSPKSAYSDGKFMVFLISMFLFGFVFLQFFSTMPLYYRDVYQLSEDKIGLLFGLNGFLIFLLEMPLTKYCEERWKKISIIIFGTILMTLSFGVLHLGVMMGVLISSVLLITIGEMLVFPFSNSMAMDRSARGNAGQYLALYSISFSISHIFSHNLGMQTIAKYGYEELWLLMTVLSAIAVLTLFWFKRMIRKDSELSS